VSIAITLDVRDEGAVDLDPVELERAQIRERRIADPEIVERNGDAVLKAIEAVQ
jgi:hypothetical protein